MSRDELRDQLRGWLSTTRGVELPVLDDAARFDELGVTSLEAASVLSRVRTGLKVKLYPRELRGIDTVGAWLDLVSARLP